MPRDQFNIRCDRELKRLLEDLGEEYSPYVRDLIIKDQIAKHNPEIIKLEIKNKKEEIQQLENKLKSPHVFSGKANQILAKFAPGFKLQAPNRSDFHNIQFIKNKILPELKKFGFIKTPEEIKEILLNFPDENNGSDNDGSIDKKEEGEIEENVGK